MTESAPSAPSEAEKLPHEPNRGIIGITESPEGTRCIGLTINGTEYILLGLYRSAIAQRVQEQLLSNPELLHRSGKTEGVKSIIGTPFDIQASLDSNQLVLVEQPGVMGVYVESDAFDKLNS